MKKTSLYLSVFIIVVIAVILLIIKPQSDTTVPPTTQPVPQSTSKPTFSWSFKKAATNNGDGLPQTEVHLIARRDGTTQERLIDTVDGGCSELIGESYEGDISGAGKVQCYGAGFGQQYRIVASGKNYSVERKFLEEAIPNTPAVTYKWEAVMMVY